MANFPLPFLMLASATLIQLIRIFQYVCTIRMNDRNSPSIIQLLRTACMEYGHQSKLCFLYFWRWKRFPITECFDDNHTNATSLIGASRNQILRGKDEIPHLHLYFLPKSLLKRQNPATSCFTWNYLAFLYASIWYVVSSYFVLFIS